MCRPCAGQTWGPLVVSFGTTLCLFWHFMVSFDTLYCVQALLDTHMGALRSAPINGLLSQVYFPFFSLERGLLLLCAHEWPAFSGMYSAASIIGLFLFAVFVLCLFWHLVVSFGTGRCDARLQISIADNATLRGANRLVVVNSTVVNGFKYPLPITRRFAELTG